MDEILTDATLAEFLGVTGTPEAIKKKFYRLRTLDPKHPRHLKWFPVGGEPRYKRSDVDDWIARNTRHSTASMVINGFTDDDIAEMFDEHGNLT
jgi:hypothetical protein